MIQQIVTLEGQQYYFLSDALGMDWIYYYLMKSLTDRRWLQVVVDSAIEKALLRAKERRAALDLLSNSSLEVGGNVYWTGAKVRVDPSLAPNEIRLASPCPGCGHDSHTGLCDSCGCLDDRVHHEY